MASSCVRFGVDLSLNERLATEGAELTEKRARYSDSWAKCPALNASNFPLKPDPCSLFPIPCSLSAIPCSLNPIPCTFFLTPDRDYSSLLQLSKPRREAVVAR